MRYLLYKQQLLFSLSVYRGEGFSPSSALPALLPEWTEVNVPTSTSNNSNPSLWKTTWALVPIHLESL